MNASAPSPAIPLPPVRAPTLSVVTTFFSVGVGALSERSCLSMVDGSTVLYALPLS